MNCHEALVGMMPPAPSRVHETDSPLVLLLGADAAERHHADTLLTLGFRVVSLSWSATDVESMIGYSPSLVAIEMLPVHVARTLALAKAFRESPLTRRTPIMIYGPHLRTRDIEGAARAGMLWLQLTPSDSIKFVAAVRGLLAGSSQ
jgi:hypothetical protein